jgi:hypothetical protein
VQGGWPAIIYPAAAIAAADLRSPAWQRLLRPAVALGFAMTLLVYVEGVTHAFSLPVPVDPIALRLEGWDALASSVDATRQQVNARFVAADEYSLAAELAYNLPHDVPVVSTEQRWQLFRLPHANLQGQVGILVRSTHQAGDIGGAGWIDASVISTFTRGGGVETYQLLRVTAAADVARAVLLPQRNR